MIQGELDNFQNLQTGGKHAAYFEGGQPMKSNLNFLVAIE